MCSRTDICVCTYTGERSGDIELSSLDAQLSDDAPIADSANDSANDQLTVPQPVGTSALRCMRAHLSLSAVCSVSCVMSRSVVPCFWRVTAL